MGFEGTVRPRGGQAARTLHLPHVRLLIVGMLRKLVWPLVALAGAVGWGVLALHRGETISAAWLVLAAVGTYLVAFRFYSRFLADRVFGLNDRRATPAERLANGRDYVPTSRWVLFGHHFAAIAGAGPLVGPVLAAQFGYLPGHDLDRVRRRAARGRCRTSSSCSPRCAGTASRWGRWRRRRPGR